MMYDLALAQGFGVLEHPKEPDDIEKPSIWRLPLIRALLQLNGVDLISLSQGLWGAATPKPINLMTVNLPHLQSVLRQHQITKQLRLSFAIGTSADGTWNTAPLKEYPPAVNRGLAQAFCHKMWSLASATIFCRG